jgi:hypothetical protein
MSAERRLNPNPDASAEGLEWAPVPVVVDVNGDRLVTIHDEDGRAHTRPVAELVLESFVGPRPPGHVLQFKDGNRLNCALVNLEWAPTMPVRDESARARTIATRERADVIRKALEGRRHSDSAELVAEDRLR